MLVIIVWSMAGELSLSEGNLKKRFRKNTWISVIGIPEQWNEPLKNKVIGAVNKIIIIQPYCAP